MTKSQISKYQINIAFCIFIFILITHCVCIIFTERYLNMISKMFPLLWYGWQFIWIVKTPINLDFLCYNCLFSNHSYPEETFWSSLLSLIHAERFFNRSVIGIYKRKMYSCLISRDESCHELFKFHTRQVISFLINDWRLTLTFCPQIRRF